MRGERLSPQQKESQRDKKIAPGIREFVKKLERKVAKQELGEPP